MKGKYSYGKLAVSAIIVLFMALLICNPEQYIKSVSSGLYLYAIAVLPSLFPFFFFTKLLTGLGTADALSNTLSPIFKKTFKTSGIASYIFLMSILSGYPVGAKLTYECYEGKLISSTEARRISTFCSTSGPLFIIGTVGSTMLHNSKLGYIILLAHYLGSITNGIIYGRLISSHEASDTKRILNPSIDSANILYDSITNSITSILIVGGYIAIFGMVVDMLINIGVVNMLTTLLIPIFSLFKIPCELASPSIIALVEITRGCKILSTSIHTRHVICLASFLITSGGLSVIIQSLTFLTKCHIKPLQFALSKLTQGLFAYIFAYILCLLCGI